MPNPPTWKLLHPALHYEGLGYLPSFLDLDDPRPAREQLDSAYSHGGGWRPFSGFTLDKQLRLHYPGDPSMSPLAEANLREERIFFYPHSWVMILQTDGQFEISRMD